MENFSNALSGWPILNFTGLNTGYVNGEYQVHVTETDSLQAITAGALAKDVTIELRARRVAISDGAYGISFGITPQWQTYYVALVGADSFSLWRYANGNWSPLSNWTPDPVINTGTGQNQLKIIKQQNMIRFFINNKLVTSVSDTTLTDWRRVGVVVMSSETQASDVRFDDFRMSPACYP